MGEIRQAIVVRTDLGMGRGKIAAQVGHACVMGAEHVRKSNPGWYGEWQGSQPKIVLKVQSLKELEAIGRHAAELGLPWARVTDAGRTQLEPGTVTCISIGPAPGSEIDRVTSGLKLL